MPRNITTTTKVVLELNHSEIVQLVKTHQTTDPSDDGITSYHAHLVDEGYDGYPDIVVGSVVIDEMTFEMLIRGQITAQDCIEGWVMSIKKEKLKNVEEELKGFLGE